MILLWLLLGLAQAAECETCHPVQAAQHADSTHARAFETAVFRATWDEHPLGWCVTCHLPDAADQATLDPGGLQPGRFYETDRGGGLSCATCHVRDGVVLTGRPPGPRARAAHAVRHEPGLGSEACIACH